MRRRLRSKSPKSARPESPLAHNNISRSASQSPEYSNKSRSRTPSIPHSYSPEAISEPGPSWYNPFDPKSSRHSSEPRVSWQTAPSPEFGTPRYSPKPGSNGRSPRSSPTDGEAPCFIPHRASLNGNEKNMVHLCLNPPKVNSRRYSSEMLPKPFILPRVAISRAKSDSILNPHGQGNKSLDGCRSVLVNGEQPMQGGGFCIAPSYITLRPCIPLKDHNFVTVAKVLSSNKCRICSETIYFSCNECTQCKLIAHKKCLPKLYVKCPSKRMPPRLAVFGLNISNDNQVAEVLMVCIREIENRPIHKLKGIYKTDSNQAVVENLALSFEFGAHLVDLSQVSVHDVAGVVKEYLVRLSTPIFNRKTQIELISLGRDWPVRRVPYTPSGIAILIFELRQVVGAIKESSRNNLAYLLYHFRRVVDRHNITEMTANSLAVVFANIFFRAYPDENTGEVPVLPARPPALPSPGRSYMAQMTINIEITFKIRILELMILHVQDIFC